MPYLVLSVSTLTTSYIWPVTINFSISFSLFPNTFLGLSRYDPLMPPIRRAIHFAGRAIVIGFAFMLPLASEGYCTP